MSSSQYSNFLQDIESAVGAQTIECFVILSQHPAGRYGREHFSRDFFSNSEHNIPLDWATHKHKLDYPYYTGYGFQDCHDIYVYTASQIFFIHDYDGATSIHSIPRNPPPAV